MERQTDLAEIASAHPGIMDRMRTALISNLLQRGLVTAPELYGLQLLPWDDLLDVVFGHTGQVNFVVTDDLTISCLPGRHRSDNLH